MRTFREGAREGEKMSGEEKLMSIPEVKQVLEGVREGRELSYEQKNALDHLRKFSKISETR